MICRIFVPIEDTNYISTKCKLNEEKVKNLEANLATLRFKQQNDKFQLKEDINTLKNNYQKNETLEIDRWQNDT